MGTLIVTELFTLTFRVFRAPWDVHSGCTFLRQLLGKSKYPTFGKNRTLGEKSGSLCILVKSLIKNRSSFIVCIFS